MLFIAIFILKIQCSIYDVGSKGMGPSSEIGSFAKTLNEHCLASLAYYVLIPYDRVLLLVSNFLIKNF